MNKKNKVREAFRDFAVEASQTNADDKFLERLRKLTGQATVPDMLKRFQKLAGIKTEKKRSRLF